MNRNENVTFLDLAFITLGFEFRNAQTDESTGNAADGCSYGHPAQRGDNRSGGDKGADSRNGQCANARDPAQRPDHSTTSDSTGDSSFRSFGTLLVREVVACAF